MDVFNRRERRDLTASASSGIGGMQPPHISIKANRFTLVDAAGVRFAWPAMYMDVVILDINPNKSKVYWDKYDPAAEDADPPICFSDNGIAPSINAFNPQSETCASCPWDVWGSATNELTGKARKACSDRKKVAVLVIGDTAAMPYQLQIPPASLKPMLNYANQVSVMNVPGKNTKADLDYVVTRVSFVPDKNGELQFQCVGWISSVQQNQNGGFALANDGQRLLLAEDRGMAIASYVDRLLDSGITESIVGKTDRPRTLAIGAPPTGQQITGQHNPQLTKAPERAAISQERPAAVAEERARTTDRPVFDQTAMGQAQQRGPAPSAPAGATATPGHGGRRPGSGRKKSTEQPAALTQPTMVPPAAAAGFAPFPAAGFAPPWDAATRPIETQHAPVQPPTHVAPMQSAPAREVDNTGDYLPADDGIPAELRRAPNPAFAESAPVPSELDQALEAAFKLIP